MNNYDKLISFTILRIHVGGYHAKSEHQCKVQSAIVTVLALVLIKEISFMAWYGYWVMVMISIFIMVNAPVEAKNKPLS
ncbi:MAG: accessory gene regulator B family protein, partial [Lachnospiraceae bacterium]|nr:accessory gene regulator B family protein [Lachnospiraceae bacterium]